MIYHDQSEADTDLFWLSTDGTTYPVGDHFTLIEFACKDGTDLVIIHPALVAGLEALRTELGGFPLHITSAYRTKEHNQAVSGRPFSKHLLGMAADVVSRHHSPYEVAEAAKRIGFGGVGQYVSFVHCDVSGRNRRWFGAR